MTEVQEYEKTIYAEEAEYLSRKIKVEYLMQDRKIPSKQELETEIKKRLEDSRMKRGEK